jgi:rubrerythrin
MNIYKIIDEIGKQDPEVNEKLSRRDMFKNAGSFGKKVAVASIPLAFAETFKQAFGKSNDIIIDVLNYALGLEYLENEFYQTGITTSGLIPAANAATFAQIAQHEKSHVAFLTTTIKSLGGTPATKPTFDFSAGGAYTDTFSNFQTFLTLSNAFEDTGVRAYKGRAADLLTNKTVLAAALQIHSVEARHASVVRRIRAQKGWIDGAATTGVPPAIYAGEDNIVQGGVTVTTGLANQYSVDIATEAFDEPLTSTQVTAIVTPFIKP